MLKKILLSPIFIVAITDSTSKNTKKDLIVKAAKEYNVKKIFIL